MIRASHHTKRRTPNTITTPTAAPTKRRQEDQSEPRDNREDQLDPDALFVHDLRAPFRFGYEAIEPCPRIGVVTPIG